MTGAGSVNAVFFHQTSYYLLLNHRLMTYERSSDTEVNHAVSDAFVVNEMWMW